jgi:hypothetical protein
MPSWLGSVGTNEEVADLGRYVQETFPTDPEPEGGRQVPGDCNQDHVLNVADAVCELQRLFYGRLGGAPARPSEPVRGAASPSWTGRVTEASV